MEVIEFKNVVWDMTRRISECMDGMFRPISEQYGLTHMQMRILMDGALVRGGFPHNRPAWAHIGDDQRKYVLHVQTFRARRLPSSGPGFTG